MELTFSADLEAISSFRATLFLRDKALLVSVVVKDTSAVATEFAAQPAVGNENDQSGHKMIVCGQWEKLASTSFPMTANCRMRRRCG